VKKKHIPEFPAVAYISVMSPLATAYSILNQPQKRSLTFDPGNFDSLFAHLDYSAPPESLSAMTCTSTFSITSSFVLTPKLIKGV